MKAATSVIDTSILPDQARRELHDFYRFLVSKYVKRQARPAAQATTTPGTASALVASPIVGIWRDRELGDSAVFARSLREKAQRRTTV